MAQSYGFITLAQQVRSVSPLVSVILLPAADRPIFHKRLQLKVIEIPSITQPLQTVTCLSVACVSVKAARKRHCSSNPLHLTSRSYRSIVLGRPQDPLMITP